MTTPVVASELARWARTRLLDVRVAALVAVTAFAATAAGGTDAFAGIASLLPTVALLVATFRYWDDLADAELDRVRRPGRVLARSARRGAHAGLAVCAVLICAPVVAAVVGTAGLLGLASTTVALAALYGTVPAGHALREPLVLLKYPAFVALLQPAPLAIPLAACTAALYAALVLNELHERRAARPDATS